MGMQTEFNWYVVCDKEQAKDIQRKEKVQNVIGKDGDRIYPLDSPLPFIVRGEGCIGLVKVINTTITKEETMISFEFTKVFREDNKEHEVIADHYYSLYLDMKNI